MTRVVGPVVRRERDGLVARLIVGSGVRRNALSTGAWAGIERACDDLANDPALRAVIIEGAAGWFCAGSDIREWEDATPEAVDASFAHMESACTAIERLPVPVIAKIRGPAAGAGCQLALACDLRLLADNAVIGMPIAVLGILVSPAFANRLAAVVGPASAGDLLYTGRMVGAAEAVSLGLASAWVSGDDLDRRVDEVVDSILRGSDASVRAAKQALGGLSAPARALAKAGVPTPRVDLEAFRRGVRSFVHRRRRRTARVPT